MVCCVSVFMALARSTIPLKSRCPSFVCWIPRRLSRRCDLRRAFRSFCSRRLMRRSTLFWYSAKWAFSWVSAVLGSSGCGGSPGFPVGAPGAPAPGAWGASCSSSVDPDLSSSSVSDLGPSLRRAERLLAARIVSLSPAVGGGSSPRCLRDLRRSGVTNRSSPAAEASFSSAFSFPEGGISGLSVSPGVPRCCGAAGASSLVDLPPLFS